MRLALRRNRAVAMVRDACHVDGTGMEESIVARV